MADEKQIEALAPNLCAADRNDPDMAAWTVYASIAGKALNYKREHVAEGSALIKIEFLPGDEAL
jgi:hypothetical protein